jgi:hypothetical protein
MPWQDYTLSFFILHLLASFMRGELQYVLMAENTLPWEQPGWLIDARKWIHTVLENHGLRQTGEIEQPHIRPWSTVLRVPTDRGDLFFKATAPVLEYEAALTNFLFRLYPENSPDLLAVSLERGWMLMRDSGTLLRAFIKSEKSLERWRAIMPLYVGLQKQMMSHASQILALGVPDRWLKTLPEQFERLVADEPAMLVDQPESLTSDEYRRLRAYTDKFEKLCAQLNSHAIPASLHHDDFHDGNLFIQNDRVIFTDWGESAVTHPFFTLVVMLRGASNSLDLEADAPELAEMRDWYLKQWADIAPLDELRSMVGLAERIGLVNRALTWHRVISSLPAGLQPKYAFAVPAYLKEFINS